MRREVEELKDRNTALEEQIREYSQTIIEQSDVCIHTYVHTYVWSETVN